MNDLISREDALTALNGACSNWQDDSKVADIISGLPSAKVTGDLISRADAVEAVRKELVCDGRHETHDKTCRFIADVLLSALPSAETTGALDDAIAKYVADGLMELPSAEAEPKRVLQGYCKGADCKWWNPQVDGCNRCVMVKDEYTHPSAEAVQGWIPCSERLPKKEEETYWVCTDTKYQCECRWTNNRFGFGLGEGEWGWSIFDTPQYSKPIAWMPLPKPYREDGEA